MIGTWIFNETISFMGFGVGNYLFAIILSSVILKWRYTIQEYWMQRNVKVPHQHVATTVATMRTLHSCLYTVQP